MDIVQLRAKLARRFRRTCEGANADPSDGALEDALETARRELSKKFPKTMMFEFRAGSDGVVDITVDDNGTEVPAQVLSVTGVYIRDRGWAGLPYQSGPSEIFGNPSLGFMDSKLRDSFNRPVDFTRQGNRLKLIGRLTDYPELSEVNLWHITDVNLPATYRGIILYHTMMEWDDIPEWMEELIITRALISIMDDAVISKDGVIRLPSPMGYFEFDGGHNFRLMRENLKAQWESDTTPGTFAMFHG